MRPWKPYNFSFLALASLAMLVLLSVLLALLILGPVPATALGAESAEQRLAAEERTAAAFEASRNNPLLLHALLRAMPKGGDLHNHPSGAEFAEQYITFAAADGLCVLRETMTVVAPPCDPGAARPPVSDALRNQSLYDELVDAWSMRDWCCPARARWPARTRTSSSP